MEERTHGEGPGEDSRWHWDAVMGAGELQLGGQSPGYREYGQRARSPLTEQSALQRNSKEWWWERMGGRSKGVKDLRAG